MKDLFLNLKQSSELQKLGFNEPCFGRYDGKGDNKGKLWYEMPNSGQDTIPVGDVLAPTFSQAFRFFRKNYDLFCGILTECSYGGELHAYHITGVNQGDISKGDFYSYETAESACLDKLIELAKTK